MEKFLIILIGLVMVALCLGALCLGPMAAWWAIDPFSVTSQIFTLVFGFIVGGFCLKVILLTGLAVLAVIKS